MKNFRLCVFSVALPVLLIHAGAQAATVPYCNDSAIISSIKEDDNALRQIFTNSNVRAKSLENINQIGAHEVMRACTGTIVRTNGDRKDIGYTVEWLDENRRIFTTNVVPLKTLYKEWGVTPPSQQQAQQPQQTTQERQRQSTQQATSSTPSCDTPDGNMPDMIDCERKRLAVEDKRLNDVYKKVMAQLDQPGKTDLRDRQRLWIKLRDADCKIVQDGGQAADLNHVSCLAEKTRLRADELQGML